ncbi:GGDEF and EAL domain-containing protein [Sphingomonas jatrophae]|uniref:Diguanylate cyclase with PAS/PAC sensor n=1 Tax=Sphingomonas jatrophae TaxID=1166337 RepID=A0A1I6JDI2_9SPHN|nr:GGDEF and EAL domain-containing protein [Sphingomonas jatrophae]SFR77073.1 diguanylate cyclase with PAS/PAC sensor [Sphingomonas jatrophae]
MDALLRRSVDALPALVATLDESLRFEAANAAHGYWLGVAPASLIGRPAQEVFGPALWPLVEPGVLRALAGDFADIEVELPPAFALRWARIMITPERGAGGQIVRLHVLVTDLSRQRAMLRKLERTEATFNAAFAASAIGKALVEPDGKIAQANPAFARMLGLQVSDIVGRHFKDFTHPDDIGDDTDRFAALKRGEIDSYSLEKRYIAADGSPVDTLLTVAVVRDRDGEAAFFVSEISDLREQKLAEQAVRERSAQLALAMELVDGGVWQHNLATGTVQLSAGLARALELPPDRAVAYSSLLDRLHPEDRARLEGKDMLTYRDTPGTAVFRMRVAGCKWRWLRSRRQLVRNDRGEPVSVLGIIFDVTEERQREERLSRQASTDPLTGVLNRRGFDTALSPALREAGAPPALLLVDLDRFKPINDTYGHDMGDRVLREVVRRLRQSVRSRDIVARLGGDEFAVLLPRIDIASAEQAAQRIVTTLAEPIELGSVVVHTGASVGVAIAEPQDDAPSILRRADEALYAVKRSGRGNWRMAA